jgi:hypothetical protein
MICRPACQSVSTAQAAAVSSMLLNIQSISPLGPPTNPSIDIDIFRISFLIFDLFYDPKVFEVLPGKGRQKRRFAGVITTIFKIIPVNCDLSPAAANHYIRMSSANNHPDFLALILENKGIILKICALYCPDKHSREDLTQEIIYQL